MQSSKQSRARGGYGLTNAFRTLARQYKEIFTESFFDDGPVHLPRRELAQWLYWCVTSQRPRGGVPASFSLEKLGEFAKIITAEEARSFRESEAEWAESDNSERSFRREQPK